MRLGEFLKLPSSVPITRKFRLAGKPRRYRREPRKKFTKEEIIEYLRTNNIRSIPQLERFRKEGDPNVYDVRKVFEGKWSNAMREVFAPLLPLKPDREYLIKTVLWMNLKRRSEYLEAHKREPHVVPSIYVVQKVFGSFKNMMYCARQYDLEETLQRSAMLYLKYGRTPTLSEYNDAGIGIDKVAESFGGKWLWDKYVRIAARKLEHERKSRGT